MAFFITDISIIIASNEIICSNKNIELFEIKVILEIWLRIICDIVLVDDNTAMISNVCYLDVIYHQ
jgi:hypothetical protein